ncbi:MAG: hypothetical protein HY000_04460 [Planctomycetes bacterium]|nr:hypothetical protein [Planctomycetota bacterium]
MGIPAELVYQGPDKELQFRDMFVMPLLVRLGFGVVVNYHGQREFGRDVIFGDLDRFGHVVYYGMQIKYESSISLSDSHSLIQDAEQATHNPFKHPQTGREGFISCFYVANAGDISEPARANFFSAVARRGIRDARLLDGNALVLLDKAASLNRNANIQERLTGLLQEVRRNRNLLPKLVTDLSAFADDPQTKPFPFQRCRNSASGSYLNAPFSVPDLPINIVDQYWEIIRMLNDLADSIGVPGLVTGDYRKERAKGLATLARQSDHHGMLIEIAVMALLTQLSGAKSL